MRGIIDRFEGDYAVVELEDLTMINIEKSRLTCDIKEGDIIIIKDDSVIIDREETEKREKKLSELMKDLFE